MKLIVGLGNPGKKYEKNRHNTGFMVVDSYLAAENPQWKKKFQSLYYEKKVKEETVIFLKPQTFMNNSGQAGMQFANFYKILPEDILVISDDLDLSIGKYRLKTHGSCGGHNGLRDIETCLHSDKYKRLKVGIKKKI